MWQNYRKTIIPIQAVILVVCIYLFWQKEVPILAILYYFAVMQAFAVLGSLWSTRLRRKFESGQKRAPLRKIV